MFLKYLEPLFKPWRDARGKVMKAKTAKGNVKAEQARVARFTNVAKKQAWVVKDGKKLQGDVAKAKGQKPGMAPPAVPGMAPPAMPGMASAPAPNGNNMPEQPPNFVPNPPLAWRGLLFKTKWCTQCNQQMDKTWDGCPYCAQAYQPAPAAPKAKTQAFFVGAGGVISPPQPAWLVALKGPQWGELFTLSGREANIIGTAPTCTLVLIGKYISGTHMEIVSKGEVWMLRDLGSSNGTKVNNNQITEEELIDNDFIELGDCTYKFKCL